MDGEVQGRIVVLRTRLVEVEVEAEVEAKPLMRPTDWASVGSAARKAEVEEALVRDWEAARARLLRGVEEERWRERRRERRCELRVRLGVTTKRCRSSVARVVEEGRKEVRVLCCLVSVTREEGSGAFCLLVEEVWVWPKAFPAPNSHSLVLVEAGS